MPLSLPKSQALEELDLPRVVNVVERDAVNLSAEADLSSGWELVQAARRKLRDGFSQRAVLLIEQDDELLPGRLGQGSRQRKPVAPLQCERAFFVAP